MLQAAHTRWLREQLPALVEQGLLDAGTADRLRRHYEDEDRGAGAKVVRVLLGTLGAVFVGGGVILLVAHNWDELGRAARTALSIAPLAGALALVAWVVATGRGEAWREGAAAIWTLAIAATISLVSQTYHLPGDWESFLRGCLLLAFPVAYLLDASTAALLYLLGLLAWVGGARDGDASLLFWPLLGLVLPFAVWRWRRFPAAAGSEMLGWAVAATVAFGIPSGLTRLDDAVWGPLTVTGGVGLWAIGVIACEWRWERPFRVIGGLTALVVAFVLSFSDTWRHAALVTIEGGRTTVVEGVAVVTVVIAAGALLVAAMRRRGAELVLPAGAGVPVAWAALALARTAGEESAAVAMNLYLLALGGVLIAQGLREDRLRRANVGTAIVGVLILLRFFDTDWGFLVRGAAFIAVGLAFLLVNSVLLRRRAAP